MPPVEAAGGAARLDRELARTSARRRHSESHASANEPARDPDPRRSGFLHVDHTSLRRGHPQSLLPAPQLSPTTGSTSVSLEPSATSRTC